ncbi:hypothetical protein V6U77_09155 [Micromonospora sp. CPCC 205546]|uniref:hypothetical protein n=1 Tax=Micromonospora sp. CPCC 205546 TaxID=3122397 RepID=UPI002FF17324
MAITEWNTLRTGSSDEVVLLVDFSAEASRMTAGFSNLVPLLPERYTVRAPQRAAWTGETDGGAGAAARLEQWLATADQFGAEVVAVLGYCAGCRLSAAFADRLTGPTPPAVVFLDPLPVFPETLLHEYQEAVNGLAPDLEPAVVELATRQAQDRVGTAADLTELATWLSGSYRALAVEGCRKLGIDDEFTEQLVARLTDYLQYLTIAAAAPPPRSAPDLVLRSNTPMPSVLTQEYPAAELVDVPRADLLGSREVADLVTRVLSADAAGAGEHRS